MEVLEAHTPLKLEEEGVKGLEEWFLKEVTTNLAQKWRKWVPEGCKIMCQVCEATEGLEEKQRGAQ